MRKNNGFTVIELLVTIAMLAILVVMAINLGRSSIQRSTFTSTVNGFIADLSYARMLAANTNRHVAFAFKNDGTSYSIRLQKQVKTPLTEDENTYTEEKVVEPMSGRAFVVPGSDFKIDSMGVIRKYPSAVTADPITVTLEFYIDNYGTGSKDYEKKLTLYPTGGIKIEDKN